MIRILVVAVALTVGIQAAVPQNLDVIKERKQTMKQTGAAAGSAAKMLKGEAPFDLAAVQASLKTMVDAAAKMPALFPDDSKTGGDTRALPAIWADKADLNARYAKLGQGRDQRPDGDQGPGELRCDDAAHFQELRRLPRKISR